MKEIKVLELFAGYGGASFALKKVGIPHKVIGFSEIDKFASRCYMQNHYDKTGLTEEQIKKFDKNFDLIDKDRLPKELGDITKIDEKELEDFDILTGGFPCQAFSLAGYRKGFDDTRGTLVYEILRIAKHKKPKIMLLENVKGLLNHDNGKTFEIIQKALVEIGYKVKIDLLNSKDYGTPQNRERLWFVCFREDLKKEFIDFNFPRSEKLTLHLKDILEPVVDKKYFLTPKQLNAMITSNFNSRQALLQKGDVSSCLLARDFIEPKCIEVGDFRYDDGLNIRKDNRVSPCLTSSMGMGGGLAGKPLLFNVDKETNDKMNLVDGDGNPIKNVPEIPQAHRIYNTNGVVPSLNCGWSPQVHLQESDVDVEKELPKKTRDLGLALDVANKISNDTDEPVQLDVWHLKHSEIRPLSTYIPQDRTIHRCLQAGEPKEVLVQKSNVRKLTPKECFRLMGFFNDEINLNGLSNAQIYKLAGNGWDIGVISKIMIQLFRKDHENYDNVGKECKIEEIRKKPMSKKEKLNNWF